MRTTPRRLGLLWGLSLALATGGTANAESALRLDWPPTLGVIPAATYDTERAEVGKAHVVIERLDDGNVRVLSESGFTGGARTVTSGLFEPVDGDRSLRPLLQESRSFDPQSQPLGKLEIDHRAGIARCYTPEFKPSGEVALPDIDRVANVTLNLLFLPLVRKEQEKIDFQIFFCGLGMRVVDFEATLTRESRNGGPHPVLEVRYGPDLGLASIIAPAFLPKLSFWFAPDAPHRWMAHRLPLYGRGPEVLVIRDGVAPAWLGDH